MVFLAGVAISSRRLFKKNKETENTKNAENYSEDNVIRRPTDLLQYLRHRKHLIISCLFTIRIIIKT
jgi:hypothetical protein